MCLFWPGASSYLTSDYSSSAKILDLAVLDSTNPEFLVDIDISYTHLAVQPRISFTSKPKYLHVLLESPFHLATPKLRSEQVGRCFLYYPTELSTIAAHLTNIRLHQNCNTTCTFFSFRYTCNSKIPSSIIPAQL